MSKHSDNSSSPNSSPKRQQKQTRRQENSPVKRLQPPQENQFRVIVKNLPIGIKQENIRSLFEKQGKIISIKMINKQFLSYAFIQYEKQSGFLNAIRKLNQTRFDNKTMIVEKAKPREYKPNYHTNYSRNERPQYGGNECYRCQKKGHIARDCRSQVEGNRYDNRSRRYNQERRQNRQSKREYRNRDKSEDSRKQSNHKKRDRRRSYSDQPRDKTQRRRDRSDSSSDYKYRRRNSTNRKRKDSLSSSRSNDKRKDTIERKHNRSRSIQLRKGKRRNSSRSSSR